MFKTRLLSGIVLVVIAAASIAAGGACIVCSASCNLFDRC